MDAHSTLGRLGRLLARRAGAQAGVRPRARASDAGQPRRRRRGAGTRPLDVRVPSRQAGRRGAAGRRVRAARGRSGPGAGRPAKLYRRSDREFSVHLPERAYALAGELLARAIEDADSTGASPRAALSARAHDFGRGLGADTGCTETICSRRSTTCGYEPRRSDGTLVLVNCPFHTLARQHTDMVCGMNLALLSGLLDGAGCEDRRAILAPAEGYCCVRIESEQPPARE